MSDVPFKTEKFPTELAPVVLFVFNRLEHTQKTVEALKQNYLASRTQVIAFSDGWRKPEEQAKVQVVREFLKRTTGFASFTLVERERNHGLAKSVITGVTEVLRQYKRVIVVEDDLVTSRNFLCFMNTALDYYQSNARVFSVSGWGWPINYPATYPYDSVLVRRGCPWGWGTWEERWEKADWEMKDYPGFQTDLSRQHRFNQGGEDLSPMLIKQMEGRIDSWAIRWHYTHHRHDAFCALARKTKVQNIGFDGSGVHCSKMKDRVRVEIDSGEGQSFRFADAPDPVLEEKLRALFRKKWRKRLRWFVRLKCFEIRRRLAWDSKVNFLAIGVESLRSLLG
jgi:hypothetical protein